MQIYDYVGPNKYDLATQNYHEEFGCSDYMKEHYDAWTIYPTNHQDPNDEGLLKVYTQHNNEKLPEYVIETFFCDGDFLCFKSSLEAMDYINSLMPLIIFEMKKHKYMHDLPKENDGSSTIL